MVVGSKTSLLHMHSDTAAPPRGHTAAVATAMRPRMRHLMSVTPSSCASRSFLQHATRSVASSLEKAHRQLSSEFRQLSTQPSSEFRQLSTELHATADPPTAVGSACNAGEVQDYCATATELAEYARLRGEHLLGDKNASHRLLVAGKVQRLELCNGCNGSWSRARCNGWNCVTAGTAPSRGQIAW